MPPKRPRPAGLTGALLQRSAGYKRPREVARMVRRRWAEGLERSSVELVSAHRSNATSVAVDRVESRYALSGGTHGAVALYDLAAAERCGAGGRVAPLAATRAAHARAVTSVAWYPVDTGLFVSAGADQAVKVWDANALAAVVSFDLGAFVYCAALPTAAAQHSLVACATEDPRVRLCDMLSGAVSHMLVGHTQRVMAAAWSPANEHVLATGGSDGTVRVWDVRRSGAGACVLCLDMHGDHSAALRPNFREARGTLARAHRGSVNGLQFTPDGLALVSTGTDARVRLWRMPSGEHTHTNFAGTRNKHTMRLGMAVAADAGLLFHPNEAQIGVYRLASGRQVGTLRGHFAGVAGVAYREERPALVSVGADGFVLLWTSLGGSALGSALGSAAGAGASAAGEDSDEDAWSD